MRQCRVCGIDYQPTGPAQKMCVPCGRIQAAIVSRRSVDANRRRNGVRVGIGSGNGQPKGAENPRYKNGIGFFHAFSRGARQTIRYCERCRKDLLNAKTGQWAVHHRDHDRTNNPADGSNFELLCKACHQREHRCWEAFVKAADPRQRVMGPRQCPMCDREYQPTGWAQKHCWQCIAKIRPSRKPRGKVRKVIVMPSTVTPTLPRAA